MLWRIYRIQLYVTMMLCIGFFLLLMLGDGLQQTGLMKVLAKIVGFRLVLPIGTVLAIFARREGVDSGTLVAMQAVSLFSMLPGAFGVLSYALASVVA